ncbi:MAG: MFS transporter [Acidobacteriota bacterium]
MQWVRAHLHPLLRRETLIVALLVISVIVNYADRSNLAIAAPVITHQLSLSPTQMGALLAAFSWTYAFLQLFGLSGWLADRFPVGYVLLIGYVLWTLATCTTGLLSGFTTIFIARLVLGAGESVAYPCYSRVFAELPQHQRGRANAFIDAGTNIGPSLGALIGGLIMVHLGWRALFVILGLGGLLWVLPWLAIMPRTRTIAEQSNLPKATTAELLHVRSAWGTFLGHFCGNYVYYFLLAWLPTYLVQEVHMSLAAMARFTSFAFLLIACSTLAVGWLTDRLIRGGLSATLVRKTAASAGLACGSLLALATLAAGSSHLSLVLLLIACSGYGAYASNHWAITQTLAGPSMAGRWSGVQNGVANLSGIVGPWLSGAILQRTGSLHAAFLVAAAIALFGSLCWALIVARVEPVNWSTLHRAPQESL